MTNWTRSAALAEVRGRLWRYLSGAATPEAASGAAESLWELPMGEMRRLVATRICTSDATERMLDAVEDLLPRLPSNTKLTEEEVVGHVAGPIDWQRTHQLQLASGDRTRFICLPATRHYESPLAHLVAFVLEKCQELCIAARMSGGSGPARIIVTQARARSARLARHTKVRDVAARRPDRRQLAALQRRRGVAPIVEFAELYSSGYERLELPTVQQVVESHLLAPMEDDKLFELQVGFRLAVAFESNGFSSLAPTLIEPGSPAPLARLQRDGREVRIWWQRSALPLAGIDVGRYGEALSGAGLQGSALLPDLTIEFLAQNRIVLVEIKHTSADRPPVHAGIKDALLYLMDAQQHFARQPYPHALVAALGAAAGNTEGRVVVTGADAEQLEPLVAAVVKAHHSET